jgi:D-glycero-D-manno-heptose 1,7-bisphosphate phosphatase
VSSVPGKGRPAAFIDRDGVINEERDYVSRIEDFFLLPGVIQGLAKLRDAGYALVVVTNQSGIGRGLYSEADYERLSAHMRQQLAEYGIELSGVYHCPHHPTASVGAYRVECSCRKPKPGMLHDAARDLGLSLPESVLVGDKVSDIEAGRRAGLGRCVLVTSGHALNAAERATADACVADLQAAARWLVAAR